MHLSRRVMVFLAGLALLPLLGIFLTAILAGIFGCEVNEGGPTPCLVMGADIGGLLSAMLTTGWFALITIPLLMVLLGAWSLIEAYVWGRRRRKDRRANREGKA